MQTQCLVVGKTHVEWVPIRMYTIGWAYRADPREYKQTTYSFHNMWLTALGTTHVISQLETCSDVIMRSITATKQVLQNGLEEEHQREEKNGNVSDATQKNSP